MIKSKHKYGRTVASELASKREAEALTILQSTNKLPKYALVVSIYSFTAYFLWYSYFYLNNDTCTDHELKLCPKPLFDETLFRQVSLVTSGVFISSFFIHILQGLESEVKDSIRTVPIYCTAVINLIAFISHFSMSQGLFPTVTSVWGRASHVSRWGEWISLVPFLMIMMNSIDVRDKNDVYFMFLSTLLQLFSVITGAIASFTTNVLLAYLLMILSCVSYSHIFYCAYRAIQRYKQFTRLVNSNRNFFNRSSHNHNSSSSDSTPTAAKVDSNSIDTRDQNIVNDNDVTITNEFLSSEEESNESHFISKSMSTKDIILHVEQVGTLMSIKLTVYCALTWTIKVGIYGLGCLNLISHEFEAISQSVMDCVSKCFYARILCTSHGSALSPEGLLGRMLRMEENANASIRQFLRFVFHEISTPLNTMTMTLQHLIHEELTEEGNEMLFMARESCININETLHGLLDFQVIS